MKTAPPNSPYPRFLFRCFDEEQHARRLLDGYVWISTIGWLRSTERGRGDPDEATATYYPGVVDSDDQSAEMQQTLQSLETLGIKNGGTMKWFGTGDNITITRRPQDGYLLCTSVRSPTAKMRTAFGKYCVRIADSKAFIEALAGRMGAYSPSYQAGRVDYSGREYRGSARIPADAFFLGPPSNADEAEYRIHFPPQDGAEIEPFELHVPGVARLCSLV